MNWLQKFMVGRYGGDQLSMALLILSLVIALIARISGNAYISLISYIPLGFGVFRMLSRNISKRSMENYKFSMIVSPIYSKSLKIGKRFKEIKTHKYFKCQKCKTQLRVPKGKGKIMITCVRCKNEFIKKT